MTGPEHMIELFHGYTYSGSPIACAAAIATLELYREEGLFQRAAEIAPYWEEALHSLKGTRHVIDIRNLGLIGAIELEPIAGRADQAGVLGLREGVREGHHDPHHRRHHRHVAAADHREGAYRPAGRHPAGGAGGDRVSRPPAVATTLIDDLEVRVTRFDFAPGAETGWHRHGLDYVITALTDCAMLLEEPGGGSREVLVTAGSAYRRDAGVEHNVVNGGTAPMSFVEVELRDVAG